MLQPIIFEQIFWCVAELFNLSLNEFLTACDIFLAILTLEPRTNFLARITRCHDIQPVAAWTIIGTICNDFDKIAILELILKRHDTPVDLRANAVMSNLRVYAIGKINRVGAFGQNDKVAPRREDKYLVAEEIQLQRLKIFFRVFNLFLQLCHLT